MDINLFDFELPESRIATRPAEPRDSARMLVVRGPEAREDHIVTDLLDELRAGDVMVVNDTRVIPAELKGIREATGGGIHFNLHQIAAPDTWAAFAKPAKKCKRGETIRFADDFTAVVADKTPDGEVFLKFDRADADLMAALEAYGGMPLPPYIAAKRKPDEKDREDYQTHFADKDGAVAAPTAGLHFTPDLLDRIKEKGVTIETVTLHVGAGTFLPVKAEDTNDHKMHSEWGHIDADTADRLNKARQNGGRLVAVGTTSLRLLESATGKDKIVRPFKDSTDIFITPGYTFCAVDMLMTNFHLPKSTLFMLVSAFAGLETMQSAYKHAIDHEYRFYSYGDASLLYPEGA